MIDGTGRNRGVTPGFLRLPDGNTPRPQRRERCPIGLISDVAYIAQMLLSFAHVMTSIQGEEKMDWKQGASLTAMIAGTLGYFGSEKFGIEARQSRELGQCMKASLRAANIAILTAVVAVGFKYYPNNLGVVGITASIATILAGRSFEFWNEHIQCNRT